MNRLLISLISILKCLSKTIVNKKEIVWETQAEQNDTIGHLLTYKKIACPVCSCAYGLASHPRGGGSKNTPSCLMLQKLG